jgi:AraC family transcriptional regulator
MDVFHRLISTRRLDAVNVCGVPSKLLGRMTSAHGVELVASQCMLIEGIEHQLTTDIPTLSIILQVPDTVMSQNGKRLVSAGRLNFFVPGSDPYTLRGTGLMTGIACVFHSEFLARLSEGENGFDFTQLGAMVDIESERLVHLGRAMFREAVNPGFAGPLYARTMGMAVALELARYHVTRGVITSSFPDYELTPRQIRQLEAYVRAHLSADLMLNDLAALIGMSARHLSRAWRLTRGTSIQRWIAECRLAESRRLLAETDLPIFEIARRCAFPDSTAFSMAFSASTGFAPGEFRGLTAEQSRQQSPLDERLESKIDVSGLDPPA